MAVVRATCNSDGCRQDVRLTPSDVVVRVCSDDYSRSFYVFNYPLCLKMTVKPADERIIEQLRGAGSRVDIWHLPIELFERKTGEVISLDDVLDLGILLEDEEAFWNELGGFHG